jgi:hypothetical protein
MVQGEQIGLLSGSNLESCLAILSEGWSVEEVANVLDACYPPDDGDLEKHKKLSPHTRIHQQIQKFQVKKHPLKEKSKC